MVSIMIIAIILFLSLNIQFASSFSYLTFKTKLNVTFLEILGKINVFKLIYLFNRVNLLSHDSVSETVIENWGYKYEKSLSSQSLQSDSFMLFFSAYTRDIIICSLNTSFNLSDKPMKRVELLTVIIHFLHIKNWDSHTVSDKLHKYWILINTPLLITKLQLFNKSIANIIYHHKYVKP